MPRRAASLAVLTAGMLVPTLVWSLVPSEDTPTLSYQLDVKGIGKSDYYYYYDLPPLDLPLFSELAFQTDVVVRQDGRNLRFYYAPALLKGSEGFFVITRTNNNSGYRLLLTPFDGKIDDNTNITVSFFGMPSSDERYSGSDFDVAEGQSKELKKKTSLFSRDVFGGIAIMAAADVNVAFGANGYDLYSFEALMDTFRRFSGIEEGTELSVRDFARLSVDFLQNRALMTSRNAIRHRSSLNVLTMGEGHCGPESQLGLDMAIRMGIGAFTFGAADDVWGHTMTAVSDGRSSGVLDLYSGAFWELNPGEASLTPELAFSERHQSFIGRIWDDETREQVEDFSRAVGRNLTRGYLAYYRKSASHDWKSIFRLKKGDVLLIDGRPIQRESTYNVGAAVSFAGVRGFEALTCPRGRKAPLHALSFLYRNYREDQSASESFSDVFEVPHRIRKIVVSYAGGETGPLTLTLSGSKLSPRTVNSVDEANVEIQSIVEGTYKVEKVQIKGHTPSHVLLVMDYSPMTLNLRRNELWRCADKRFSRDTDDFYHVLDETMEYITLASNAAQAVSTKLLRPSEIDRIYEMGFGQLENIK